MKLPLWSRAKLVAHASQSAFSSCAEAGSPLGKQNPMMDHDHEAMITIRLSMPLAIADMDEDYGTSVDVQNKTFSY